jgi:hypothetical protein
LVTYAKSPFASYCRVCLLLLLVFAAQRPTQRYRYLRDHKRSHRHGLRTVIERGTVVIRNGLIAAAAQTSRAA